MKEKQEQGSDQNHKDTNTVMLAGHLGKKSQVSR